MPQPVKSNSFKRGFKKWADEKAIELRKELNLYASSPLCAFKLCSHLGIPILNPNQISGLKNEHLNVLLTTGASHWSAATIPLPNGRFIIIHNTTHSPARQQSNLMHELAHIICEHKIEESKCHSFLSALLRNHNEVQENEAEWLGACLQLPRPALFYSLKKQMSVEEIANHYNASMEMVNYRISITGIEKQLFLYNKKHNKKVS